jgi:hypothetical protein
MMCMLRRKTPSFREITPFIAVLTILITIALAALAQTGAAGPASEQNGYPGPRLFVPAVGYDSGGYTGTAVAVGDLNGDGKLDLVVGNECASSGCPDGAGVGVLLGDGDGTFQAAVTYRSGGSSGPFWPVSIAIADVNGDHTPDLVVANGGSNTVGVLLGSGDGTFQPAVTYGSGEFFPVSVTVADLNDDGKPDIVVANECGPVTCDGWVDVLLGNGDGTFQPAVTYSSGGTYAKAVAVADVNRDGKPDLLVSGGTTGAVGVLLGNGNGTFQPAKTYLTDGRYPDSLAVADVNGDGTLDLVAANSWSGTVAVLLGNGDGTFQAAVTYSSGENAVVQISSVAVADVNGDGHPDLLLTTESVGANGNNGGAVSLLLGNGDGTFQAAVEYPSGGYQTLGVAAADVNGDGRPDVLLANSCSSNGYNCGGPINLTGGLVSVLLNNVGAPPTTTSLVSSVNPADTRWVVTYTAKVKNQSGGALTGTVLFQDGSMQIATVQLANNQAAYSTSYAVKGTHSITATYSGVLNIAAGSASPVLTETILNPYPTTTTVTTSGSPTYVGQPVTFTATVMSTYGTIPDGELVTFYDGTKTMASVALVGGKAAYTTSALSAKTHAIKATYVGDTKFRPSTGYVQQIVLKYPTTTTLASSLNPSNYGHPVTLTATVTSAGPAPTGGVIFKSGSATLGSKTLNASGVATLTTAKIPVGANTLTATYIGDASNGKSVSAAITQTVSQASISMVLTSTPNPSTFGKSVKFTARLTSNGGLPTGQPVTFNYHGATLGTANVNSYGVATFYTTALPRGSDLVTAAYAGSVDYSSASAKVTQLVN